MSENRIGAERVRHRMTQGELAEAVGVNSVTISKWEKNPSTITAGNLLKLHEVFGCSTDYLIGATNERN